MNHLNRMKGSCRRLRISLVLVTLGMAFGTLPTTMGAAQSAQQTSAPPASGDSDPGQNCSEAKSEFCDGWRKGVIETRFLLSPQLGRFVLHAGVQGHQARLVGVVGDEIDRALAQAIARGVDGIEHVDNRITVVRETRASTVETAVGNIAAKVEDATITAKVKTALLRSDFVSGMDIDVETRDSTVTLSGAVSSPATKTLAEQLASNVDGVSGVVNRIEVVAGGDGSS